MGGSVGSEGRERNGGLVIGRVRRSGRVGLGRNWDLSRMCFASLLGKTVKKAIRIMTVLITMS